MKAIIQSVRNPILQSRLAFAHICGVAAVCAMLALPAAAASRNTVMLGSGTLAGQSINGTNHEIIVTPGASISGNFSVNVFNAMPGSAIAPLAGTPTWGNPSTSYWQIHPWVGTGASVHSVSVNLTAPTNPGVYYIAVAMGGTYNSAQIMSGTHPGWEADWVNGNKVALRPRCEFETAATQGWIPFDWYQPGIGSVASELAITAIRVVVLPQGDHIKLKLLGGILAGQTVKSNAPEIHVLTGQPISGSLSVGSHNIMPPSAIAPLAATTTWGVPSSSYWTANPWVSTGDTSHNVLVNVTAPNTPGSYRIAVALAGTYNSAQIMSGTHPGWSADWVNGNKVAQLPECDFTMANLLGWIPFNWYSPNGTIPGGLALTSVRVNVLAPDEDPDGDGYTNAEELANGTDPYSFDIGPASISTAVEVSWRSVSGRSYQVQCATNLAGPWQNWGNPIPGTGSPMSILDSTRTSGQKHYRVVLAQ